MKLVLLDENLPRLLKRELSGFEVRTVAEVGWAGIKNGKLLRARRSRIRHLGDRGPKPFLSAACHDFPLGLAVLRARTTKLEDLLPLVPALRKVLDDLKAGQVCHVGPA